MMKRQTQPAKIAVRIVVILIAVVLTSAGLKLLYPFPYRAQIIRWTEEFSLDPYLVTGLIRTESHFRSDAVSPAGAIGLMQIMPSTGEWIADKMDINQFATKDLYAPTINIRFGTWYLHYLIDRFDKIDTALMAYNAGPGNAERWLTEKDPVFPETIEYLRRVKEAARAYHLLYTLPIIGPLIRALPINVAISLRTSP